MKKAISLFLVVLALTANAIDVIDLADIWQFELDRGCTFSTDQAATDSIALPGTTDTNRKGDMLIDRRETTHLSRPYSYKGRAWYRRTVEISHEWHGKPVYLFLERTKPSHVYVDGKFVGRPGQAHKEWQDSQCHPSAYSRSVGYQRTTEGTL